MKIEINGKHNDGSRAFDFEMEIGEGISFENDFFHAVYADIDALITVDGNEISADRICELSAAEGKTCSGCEHRESSIHKSPCNMCVRIPRFDKYEAAAALAKGE